MELQPQDHAETDIRGVLESFERYNPPIEHDGKIVYARMTNPKFWERLDPRVDILWEFSANNSDIKDLDKLIKDLELNDCETKLLYPCCGQDMAPFHVLSDRAYYTDKNNLLINLLKSKFGVNAERICNKDLPAYAEKVEPQVLYLNNPADMEPQLVGAIPVDYVVSDMSVVTEFSDREIEKHVGTLKWTVSEQGEIDNIDFGVQREDVFSITRKLSDERSKLFVFKR